MKNAFITPRWIITTLLVIAAVGVMVRLGFWQLDRLEQRRAFNARVEAQINAAPLDLNQALPADDLTGMEYRTVTVRGVYDTQNEVVLRNQVNGNVPGYHLLTPLVIDGSHPAVLVDRGFIPMQPGQTGQPAGLAQYAQPGPVTVRGILRLPYVPRYFGVPDPTLAPGQTRLDAWNTVNLSRLQSQLPYPLLPVYVEVSPAPAQTGGADPNAPVPASDLPDLSEGPHMGYAIQWFSFAAVLGLGYPYFVKKQLSDGRRPGGEKTA